MSRAYYNENDKFAAQWLRNLISAGLIAAGDVDERSITEVRPEDLDDYTQCHFFAGIGGWSYALRRAGWADDRTVWTGSCPCQPFSTEGKQKGFSDGRHLWPIFHKLIAERHPPTVFGEQVASATQWLSLVRSDLEALGYAVGAVPIQAASAGAYHLRDRYWFVANTSSDSGGARLREGVSEQNRAGTPSNGGIGSLANCEEYGWRQGHTDSDGRTSGNSEGEKSGLINLEQNDIIEWTVRCADGKSRCVKPGVRLLAHGVPARVGKLRGFGNAIDPRPATEFIKAALSIGLEP